RSFAPTFAQRLHPWKFWNHGNNEVHGADAPKLLIDRSPERHVELVGLRPCRLDGETRNLRDSFQDGVWFREHVKVPSKNRDRACLLMLAFAEQDCAGLIIIILAQHPYAVLLNQ